MSAPAPLEPDWTRAVDGLLPAIVQDATSGRVLMLGYMNAEALRTTLETRLVTFYSRSRARLWTKGETSGHRLGLVDVRTDCDGDALLVRAHPAGPVCHTGTRTCFGDAAQSAAEAHAFLAALEGFIDERMATRPDGSYTARLLAEGPQRIAQKVGEEGVELALAAVGEDDARVVSESADLLYHVLVVLKSRGLALRDVLAELERRGPGPRRPDPSQ